jgi:hypothetical protein
MNTPFDAPIRHREALKKRAHEAALKAYTLPKTRRLIQKIAREAFHRLEGFRAYCSAPVNGGRCNNDARWAASRSSGTDETYFCTFHKHRNLLGQKLFSKWRRIGTAYVEQVQPSAKQRRRTRPTKREQLE